MVNEPLDNQEINKPSETQQNTLDTVEKTGLNDLIDSISNELNFVTFDEKSDIPIPVELIPPSDRKISINTSVDETLNTLVESANDPHLAVEIPFAILGNSNELTTTAMLFTNFEGLDNKTVAIDSEKLATAYNDVAGSTELTTLVVSHTHPQVPDEVKETVITNKIPQKLKNEFGIRDIGLNLSLQDLYQLESLHKQIGDKVDVMLGILMYDGNLVLVERTQQGFRKVTHRKSSQHRS